MGVIVLKKLRNSCVPLLLSLAALFALAGCGGGSSSTNVVSVSVSPSTATIIVSQSITLTSVVGGTTNLNVTWMCQYTTTTVNSSTGKATTSSKTACNSDTGNIPANSASTTVTYTAPSKVPDPTKYPLLQVIITATSAQDTKKSGAATLVLDSGIVVALTPTTATVPTSVNTTTQLSQFQFTATLTNDINPTTNGVTWLVTQGTPTTTIPYPSLTSCSPTCGSIDANGLYTAPTAVPTTATVTLVATSKADTTRFAIGTITIIAGGPITFKQISPTVVPQGASSYDIFIEAPNFTSASSITLTSSGNVKTTKDSGSGQVKVLFPIPTSTVEAPASTGARLRLNVNDLANADTYTVSISDPAQCPGGCPLSSGHGPVSFQVLAVRPTSVASLPDSIPQNSLLPNELTLALDGGYFGPMGQLAKVNLNGTDLVPDPAVSSSRVLSLTLDSSLAAATKPGLYPLTVARTTAPSPSPNNPSVTNLAVYPDYSTSPPSLGATVNLPAGSKPSAVDIDTRLGIMAVAETAANNVAFFTIGNNTLIPLACPTTSCAVNTPTGLSINQANHTVAVVDAQDQEVVVLPLTSTAGAPGVTYPLHVSLNGLLPALTPPPVPYSIGVDSDTNMALVAYSSNATPTTAKVGFLLDLNKDSQICLVTPNHTQATAPCVFAQVTLNTGSYPQIAALPHSHLALVTPGGAGVLNGIDFTKASTNIPIKSVSLTSGLVTVTVDLPTGKTLGLNPGNPGTVLIQGIPTSATTNGTNFNGAFTVQSVINATSFTYALTSTVNDAASCKTDPNLPITDSQYFLMNPCQVYLSNPNVTIGISQTAQGIAVNPVTKVAAIADANATGSNGPQIDLINSLDQSVSSITFRAGCTQFTVTIPCSNAPELLGTSSVAFQPYSNLLVSYSPQQNQVSISNPVTLRRTAYACNASAVPPPPNPQMPVACITDPKKAVELAQYQAQISMPGTGTDSITLTGASSPLTLFGGLAVDPATNQAFVVQSGSASILILNLGPNASTTLKSTHITELQVPTVSGALIGGIAGATMPQGTLVSGNDLTGVQIYGAGFDGSTQVRFDGVPLAGNVQFVSNRNLTITVPAALLAGPHKYSVDVINGSGVRSNSADFFVIKSIDLSTACTGTKPQPSSVGIADQLPGQGFAPIAVVSNSGCNNVAVININPSDANFGKFSTIATGSGPQGVAVSPRFGLAVVANNTSGSASVLDIATLTQKIAAITIGTTPTGVAIDEGTGTALITNTGSNTVSELNLALLFGSSAATTLTPTTIAVDTSPIAVAIDPDRGTNNRGLAVVSALQLISGSSPIGVLDSVDIGGISPAKSTTAVTGTVTATPTGVVFDPSRSPALFYANSSGGNIVTSFNPDTGGTSTVHVGINPTALAINPQTGGIMTINSTGQTVSIIDTLSNPFKTRSTFGLQGSPQFGIAIDQFLNLAVLVDQANNRVLIFPLPN